MKRNFVIGLLISSVTVIVLLFTINGGITAQGSAPESGNAPQAPVGSAFTYQGQLKNGGNAVTGSCQMAFRLYDALVLGSLIGSPITTTVPVTNGLFTVQLDYGAGTFSGGEARWIETAVKCTGDVSYITLSPRTKLTPTPYALYSLNNWALNGNSGTGGTGFVGTTDNTALTIGVNGTAALRIYPQSQSPNLAGGYSGNTISPAIYGATIAGGGSSSSPNRASAIYATIGGGSNNLATMQYAFVGGGYSNTVATGADYGTIAGGRENRVSSFEATVGGGRANAARGGNSVIGGGYANTASGGASFIGGGQSNVVTPTAAYGVVGGGLSNSVNAERATISGGVYNIAAGTASAIGGGGSNIANGNSSAIGGGSSNQTNGYAGTIGGGTYNTTGLNNYATVGGGTDNAANGGVATVGGGGNNAANGLWSFVGGGSTNIAAGNNTSISGGSVNYASGDYASIMGGSNNTASGYIATVAGGSSNVALGTASFAAGTRAKANHNGTFVWGDSSPFNDVASTAANQFIARASGGVTFFTTFDLSTGVTAAAGSGSWSSVSDRNIKANFSLVDSSDVLKRLAQIPISTWNYKAQDTAIRHIGPMAQDFAAAFGVGEDDKHISTIDAEGVSLAAIQGLYQMVQDKDRRIAQLETDVAQLKQGAAPAQPVNVFNVISLIALGGVVLIGLKQRRGQTRS